VILAGGAGTRFWPASRRARPKPFIPLLEEETLLAATLRRARRLSAPGQTWVVAPRALGRLTRASLPRRSRVRVLLEPAGRNTAAAVAWSAAHLAAEAPEALMAVLPADHHIPDAAAFERDLRRAARAAHQSDAIVIVGIPPSRPDPAYGYFRVRPARGRGQLEVLRFVEKPQRARARRLVASGQYLWNAGMLVASPTRILEETERWAPEVWAPLGRALDRIAGGRRPARRALDAAYRRVRPISFDYAVLERSSRIRAVKARFAWSDVGSWDALAGHLQKADGNRVKGRRRVAIIDSSGNVIWSTTQRTVALVGVEGLLVVDTGDALLVCRDDRSQDVRRVVDLLERSGREDLI
jgi:mannose-1-phosphate guanylyltransferase